jgi:hypothetical protein
LKFNKYNGVAAAGAPAVDKTMQDLMSNKTYLYGGTLDNNTMPVFNNVIDKQHDFNDEEKGRFYDINYLPLSTQYSEIKNVIEKAIDNINADLQGVLAFNDADVVMNYYIPELRTVLVNNGVDLLRIDNKLKFSKIIYSDRVDDDSLLINDIERHMEDNMNSNKQKLHKKLLNKFYSKIKITAKEKINLYALPRFRLSDEEIKEFNTPSPNLIAVAAAVVATYKEKTLMGYYNNERELDKTGGKPTHPFKSPTNTIKTITQDADEYQLKYHLQNILKLITDKK